MVRVPGGGKFKTVRAAATAAGLVKDGHAPLPQLKQYWRKASAAERAEFLSFVEAIEKPKAGTNQHTEPSGKLPGGPAGRDGRGAEVSH